MFYSKKLKQFNEIKHCFFSRKKGYEKSRDLKIKPKIAQEMVKKLYLMRKNTGLIEIYKSYVKRFN